MTSVTRTLEFIDFKKIKKSNFYELTGLSNGYLDKVKELGADKMERILSFFPELNSYWLITGRGSMLVSNKPVVLPDGIPIYDIEASAGSVVLFSDMSKEVPLGYISIPNIPKCDGAIKVVGDSMYPLIKSGDLAIYKIIESTNSIIFGEMYLVDFTLEHEDYLMTKYVKKSKIPENVLLVSYNKHHDDLDIPKDCIRNLALIKANIRFNMLK
jgi:phage repressor protein C with HTH and peptisase S24 domain